MTRRVPDRKEDGLVLLTCLGKSRFTPGVPVDRVVGVLKQVRTFLVRQMVHVFALGGGTLIVKDQAI